MLNKRCFFIVSLVAVMATMPAFSDTPATQEWVKVQVYDKYLKPQGDALNTINQRLATDVRDKIYNYDTDKNSSTYRQVLDPLNTESQTAFSGINEVLEKVDGNNGTPGSAVQLETTAQNAYGAVNELKGKIDDLQDQVDAKVSVSDLDDKVTDAVEERMGEDLNTIYDAATKNRRYVYIIDTFNKEEVLN